MLPVDISKLLDFAWLFIEHTDTLVNCPRDLFPIEVLSNALRVLLVDKKVSANGDVSIWWMCGSFKNLYLPPSTEVCLNNFSYKCSQHLLKLYHTICCTQKCNVHESCRYLAVFKALIAYASLRKLR